MCRVLSRCSCVWLSASIQTVAHQAPLSMEFSRQEYWEWVAYSPSGDLPDPGMESVSLLSPACAGGFFTPSTTWNSCTNGRDVGSTSQSGRSPRVGNGNRLQYSCLENSMDRGALGATVYQVAKNWTWLNNWACTHAPGKQFQNIIVTINFPALFFFWTRNKR